MGDRVAVIKQGRLQQVDVAAGALRPPGEPVRRRVHRLAGDEHGRGRARARRRRGGGVAFGGSTLALDPEVVSQPGRLRSFEGRAGHRRASGPRTSRTPRSTSDAPPDRRLTATGQPARGAGLGGARALHGRRAAGADRRHARARARRRRRRARSRAARGTVARSSRGSAHAPRRRSATTSSSSSTPSRMHFFDPETGSRIDDETDEPRPEGRNDDGV